MRRLLVAVLLLGTSACTVETERGEVGVYDLPTAVGDGGAPNELGPYPASYFLTMYLRDFKRYDANDPTTNPGFDNLNSEKSVVSATLGEGRKPVYRAPLNALPTFGQKYFDQWYRDVPLTNYTVVYPLPVALGPDGLYQYDSQTSGKPDTYQGVARRVFFPLDDGDPYATPFGNQGQTHNTAFTGELHATFVAGADNVLHVRADDDLYVFVNNQLAIDLGGTHVASTADLALSSLGLSVGETYALDIFYAERLGATGALTLQTDLLLVPVLNP